MNINSNRIFKGAVVSIREHDIENDTFMLIENDTKKAICIGTREQILKKYDEMEKEYYSSIEERMMEQDEIEFFFPKKD